MPYGCVKSIQGHLDIKKAQQFFLGLILKAHTHWTDLQSADGNSLESTEWIGLEILNMFNTGSRMTITKSMVELADSGIELADSITYSVAKPLKIGLWIRAFRLECYCRE